MPRPINETTYDFPTLRRFGCVYVDKTQVFHALITNPGGNNLFFISRPRRFGKSLMLSTLKAIFQGRRELFDGLAIAKADYDWSDVYPVLHFDFGTMESETVDAFQRRFVTRVKNGLQDAGCDYDDRLLPDDNFGNAIKTLGARCGKPVVVLIDEYDAPVGHAIADPDKAEAIRDRMAAFYGQLKVNVAAIRFLMMTGVTKFTQLSTFSALNNLNDLTLAAPTATLLGYTQEELEAYFGEHMREHAKVMGKTYEDYLKDFKHWYDGYRFSPYVRETVYNPVAVAKTLAAKNPWFGATWSQTGRPGVLMNILKNVSLADIDCERTPPQAETVFDTVGLRDIKPITLLVQGGYLTIADYDPNAGYTFRVPNEEVRRDLNTLIAETTLDKPGEVGFANIRGALYSGDFATFLDGLKAYYAALTYGPREKQVHEANYQRLLTVLLSACGLDVVPEATQAAGRADVVAQWSKAVYIFELKVGGTAQEALAQIHARGYAAPYRAGTKAIHLFGLAFDPAKRLLADAQAETLATP